MLSSIHPLGERTRNNHWIVTVMAFTIGATATAALIGGVLGWVGSLTLSWLSTNAALVVIGAVAVAAGVLDATGVSVPGPERQVNEHWIGAYRGWVYGGAFGIQLGTGLATYVVTWGVYATLVIELASASPIIGAVIGAVFGAGRSVGLFVAGRVDRASRLTSFHDRMATLGPPVRVAAGYSAMAIGALLLAGVVT